MSQPDLPEIYFIFPYRPVGGVSTLFLRLAEFLAENQLARTWLVDYPDGFMARNRRIGITELLPYRDDSEVSLPSNCVAIFQSITPWSIYPSLRLHDETRVLFWNCHPFNLVPTIPGFRRYMQVNPFMGRWIIRSLLVTYRSKVLQLIKILRENNALVFMDTTNVAVTEAYLGVRLSNPAFLPIPFSPPTSPQVEISCNEKFQTNEIRVGWIGRIVDFKYFPLKRALAALNSASASLEKQTMITIVGSGDYTEQLKRDTKTMDSLRVRFVNHVDPAQLDSYLVDNFDLLLAMGTCALDGAKLGIPTLLIDLSYRNVPDSYYFEWLHKRKGFTLGDFIGSAHLKPGNQSMKDRLSELLVNHKMLANEARSYVETHHSIVSIAHNFMNIVNKCTCRWGAIRSEKLSQPGVIYRTFRMIRGLS